MFLAVAIGTRLLLLGPACCATVHLGRVGGLPHAALACLVAMAGAGLLVRDAAGEGGDAGTACLFQPVMCEVGGACLHAFALLVEQLVRAARARGIDPRGVGVELAVKAVAAMAAARLALARVPLRGHHALDTGMCRLAGASVLRRQLANVRQPFRAAIQALSLVVVGGLLARQAPRWCALVLRHGAGVASLGTAAAGCVVALKLAALAPHRLRTLSGHREAAGLASKAHFRANITTQCDGTRDTA